MLFSKDEKIEELEQRLDKLEKKADEKFKQIEASFKLFRDIILKLQSEKEELKKSASKDALSKLRIGDSGLQAIVKPVKKELKENTELIRKIAMDIEKEE